MILPVIGRRSYGVRIAAVAMLVLALLWAQTLAQRHGVVHAHPAAASLNLQHAQGPHAVNPTWLDHDKGDAQCRLFDQLSHADGLPILPLVALPLALSVALFALQEGLAVARWAAFFQARAPPSVR